MHKEMVEFAEFSVYTIRHIDKLRADIRNGGGEATEARRWVGAADLLHRAQSSNRSMPILFADSTDCSNLVCWALIEKIEVEGKGTRYRFDHVLPLKGRTPQELILRSTGKTIAAKFIRPYAICRTPSFIQKLSVS
jgi:hypothetical protein